MPSPASARSPLLLLPGVLNDAELWAHQVEGLADLAEIQVPPVAGHDNLPDLAAEILAGAPPRFALAGLSMGGYTAFEILRQAPERVTRLALLDTTARPDTKHAAQRRRGLVALAQKGQFRGVTPRLLPSLIAAARLGDTALTERIFEMSERIGRDGFIRQQEAIIARPDSRALLPDIRVPALVVCGREDQLTPPARAEEMAATLPDADLLVLAGAGHLAPLERPAAVIQALRTWMTRAPANEPGETGLHSTPAGV